MPRRKINREAIARLTTEGLTERQIAQELDCNEDTVTRARRELGISPGIRMTPERRQRIQNMLDDGWSWKEIERTEGANWDTMTRHFPGTAWTNKQRDEHQSNIRNILAGPIQKKAA